MPLAKGDVAETAPLNTVRVPTKGNLSKTGLLASKAHNIAVVGSDSPYAEPQFEIDSYVEDVGMKHSYRKHRCCGCAIM